MMKKVKKLTKQPKNIFILSIIAIVLGTVFVQIIYSGIHQNYALKNYEKEQEKRKEEKKQAFQDLIDQQEETATDKRNAPEDDAEERPQLIGTSHMHIFFVRPQHTPLSAVQPLADKLSEYAANEKSSFYFLHTFYHQQAIKYSPKNFDLLVDVYPEVEVLDDLERVGDVANRWGKDMFAINKLQDQFAKIIEEKNIKLDNHNIALFIYFDDSIKYMDEAGDSFYDKKAFRSFADEDAHQAYVNAYSLSPEFATRLVEIVAHETLHLFGANDKYLEKEYGCEPIGRGDLDKVPEFPQTSSDIMCGLIEYEEGKFKRAKFADGEVVINKETAKEIGWE